MKKLEAHFTTLYITPWLQKNVWASFPWEVKHSRGKDSITFSSVEDHQIKYLHNARMSNCVGKISDDSRGQKQFDGYAFHKSEAYLIFVYPEFWCFMDILVYENEERTSTRRSITSDRAKEIAYKIIERLK